MSEGGAVVTRRRWLLATGGLGASASGFGSAAAAAATASVSAADAKAVRAVIQAQLAAFAADDGARAFALAAPGIRRQFGSADHFIAMVRRGYPVVYRPASVSFLQPEPAPGEVLQRVRMTDAEGGAWMALYRLERQPDRAWRISGCEVTQSQGRFTRLAEPASSAG